MEGERGDVRVAMVHELEHLDSSLARTEIAAAKEGCKVSYYCSHDRAFWGMTGSMSSHLRQTRRPTTRAEHPSLLLAALPPRPDLNDAHAAARGSI